MAEDDTETLSNIVVASDDGKFAYADGLLSLTTTKTSKGDIMLTVSKHRRRLLRAATSDIIGELKIPAGKQWFYTLDELERLWLFVGPSREDAPDKRQAPFVVYLYGHVIDENGQARFSIQNVTGSKDGVGVIGTQQWQGVPEVFLEKLHTDTPSVAAVRSLLPERPPAYTSEQVSLIVAASEE
ncbi:MAG: hypothetical protein ACK50J_21095 [Planctomyces sp.]